MSCPYLGQCSERNGTRCNSCMHNEERSYFVEYHEYPPSKWEWDYWPWSPSIDDIGDDLRAPVTSWIKELDDLRLSSADYTWPSHVMEMHG